MHLLACHVTGTVNVSGLCCCVPCHAPDVYPFVCLYTGVKAEIISYRQVLHFFRKEFGHIYPYPPGSNTNLLLSFCLAHIFSELIQFKLGFSRCVMSLLSVHSSVECHIPLKKKRKKDSCHAKKNTNDYFIKTALPCENHNDEIFICVDCQYRERFDGETTKKCMHKLKAIRQNKTS